jgi:hypothetical protein
MPPLCALLCRIRFSLFSMCLPSYSCRIFFHEGQTRAQHGFLLSKLSVVDPPWLWEGMLDMYCLVFLFLCSIRASLHIAHTCICVGLWPPVNDSWSFPNKDKLSSRVHMLPYLRDFCATLVFPILLLLLQILTLFSPLVLGNTSFFPM